jgi:hypothetical protein
MNNPYMQNFNRTQSLTQPSIIQSPIQQTINTTVDSNIEMKKTFDDKIDFKLINEKLDQLIQLLSKKEKKRYFQINETLFTNEILKTLPNFPKEKMNIVYTDGKTYYIYIKRKYYQLNNKTFIKYINHIL